MAQIDSYVKFEGSELNGDSTDSEHANEIEITSWVQGITQTKSATVSSAGGHTAERADIGELIFTKHIDKASPRIHRACAAGTVYSKMTVKSYRSMGGQNSTSGKSRINYLTWVCDNVLISSSEIAVKEGALAEHTFACKFSKFTVEYKQQKIDGSSASTGIVGWDAAKNTIV